MSRATCSRHGEVGGVYACEHVKRAVDKRPMPETCVITMTFADDIEDTVEAVLCDGCARHWGLTHGALVPFPDNNGNFPHVTLLCVVCYREACARDGRADRLYAACIEPRDEVPHDVLRKAVEDIVRDRRREVKIRFVESVEVHEMENDKTVWRGAVKVFDLENHRDGKRVYAWSHPIRRGRQFQVFFESPTVNSPAAAVRARIDQHRKGY